jgi:hypothetical protein
LIVFLHDFIIIFHTSTNKCTDKKKEKRTKIKTWKEPIIFSSILKTSLSTHTVEGKKQDILRKIVSAWSLLGMNYGWNKRCHVVRKDLKTAYSSLQEQIIKLERKPNRFLVWVSTLCHSDGVTSSLFYGLLVLLDMARSSFLSIMWDCLPWFNRSYWTTYSTTYYCTQIGYCLSFAYAETRLGELWRESTLEEPLRFEKGERGEWRCDWEGRQLIIFFTLCQTR